MNQMKYRCKPKEIEAIQWNGSNLDEVKDFLGEQIKYTLVSPDGSLVIIGAPQGENLLASKFDYIVFEKDFVYLMNRQLFEELYEEVI